MTLPTGQISMSQVNTELGYSSTAQISLNDSAVRTLAGVSSGAISMQNLQGKSNSFTLTISTNQTNADLRTLAVNAGWNQSSAVIATINSGVYISATSTGSTGLTISGSFPGGVQLVNNGYIVGMGGNGGTGGRVTQGFCGSPDTTYVGTAGSAGGKALAVSVAVAITNNGTIGGGGGGGGGGGAGRSSNNNASAPGGGGGGGRTGTSNSSGGARGTTYTSNNAVNGSAGTSSGGGSGGNGGTSTAGCPPYPYGGKGGDGGTWGASGATGATGGSYAAASKAGGAGGSAGACLSGNAYITWNATGTRLGAIS